MRKTLITLLLATLGGYLAWLAAIPLPWMLGAMCLTGGLAVAGKNVAVPTGLRNLFLAVLGVYLGSGVTSDIAQQLLDWRYSLLLVLIYVPFLTLVVTLFYRYAGRFDWATAFYSAAPGALSFLVLASQGSGADSRTVALLQSLRVFLLVMCAPLLASVLGGDLRPQPEVLHETLGLADVAGLLLANVVVIALLRRLQVPAAEMAGGALTTAVLFGTGLVHGTLPPLLLDAALVVLGASVGCRFMPLSWAQVRHWVGTGLAAFVLTMVIALGAAWLVQGLTDIDRVSAFLAFAPGGEGEMSLVALSLSLDATFVTVHNLARIYLLIVLVAASQWFFARERLA
ncbi:AbrB family transcriptional regulator [Marinobacterium rhizophilum]|uniref:AbrB family transcriptional regulator n=1 Tax=Marinobacterium rhizophilum TaxID=420402 RepID=A0ABY5HL01_9GAMM|nr:AbrB family transcriptional regulator [Marinobacterium rhizophilum]UTW11900.1 AbrB family transcriptional regulator [Marinobacterium rhizophilum]